MFSKFSEESQNVLLRAKKEMTLLKHPYVGSEHLLLSILSNADLELTSKLNKFGINYKCFKDEVIRVIGTGKKANSWFLYTPLLKRIIESAAIDAKEQKEKEVGVNHLFLALLEEGDGVAIRILIGMNIDIDVLYDEFSTKIYAKKNKSKQKLMIEEFAVDLNKKASIGELDPVICRDNELNNVIEILSRRGKNNPLLIGEAGVGKTSIVEELANRINLDMVPKSLKNKRILSVAIASLVAGTKYRGEFEERISKILKEVEENENIILFIDEIHTLVGAGGAEGAIDASNILKPALARGKIKVIGATTNEEYKKYIEKEKALDRRFQKIVIKEPNKDATKKILLKLKPLYESYHNTIISDEIINFIVDETDKYIHMRSFPDKAIDVLDEVCAKTILIKNSKEKKIEKLCNELKIILKNKKSAIIKEDFDKASFLKNEQNKIENEINNLRLKLQDKSISKKITKEMVIDTISVKSSIPIYEQNINNKKILKLESTLNKKVFGQEQAISVVSNFAKRCQLGFSNNKVHSFMLVGKTGIGKTMLVKEYADYIIDEKSFIRLDMSEYKESHSVSKILGSPPGYVGYDDNNHLLDKIKCNPYSILLLDEIEKANQNVIKLFLQILDEGQIKDSKGNIVYFNNVTIFMTSNLGCDNNKIGFSNNSKEYIIDKLNNFFGIEFVNRIDDIIIFNPLSRKIIKKVISTKLSMLKKYYLEKNIKLDLSTKIVDKICDNSNYEKYGARKIDKIIDKKINDYIINQILNGNKKISVIYT